MRRGTTMARAMSSGLSLLAAIAAGIAGAPSAASAQDVVAALDPDTARVGDPVQIGVRVRLPEGYRVAFPDSLELSGDLENASRPVLREDSLTGGVRAVTAVYEINAWRPGPQELPDLTVQVVEPDGARTELVASLPTLTVVSVLPGDTAGIETRPAKGVLGPSWLLWPWLLLLAALLAVGVVAWIWYRRRKGYVAIPLVTPPPPTERVLAALDRPLELGLLETGEHKAFYSLLAEALRRYVARAHPEWGEDLTTEELIDRMRGIDPDPAKLRRILLAADMVKFANYRPKSSEARELHAAAREWVHAFDARLGELTGRGAGAGSETESPEGAAA